MGQNKTVCTFSAYIITCLHAGNSLLWASHKSNDNNEETKGKERYPFWLESFPCWRHTSCLWTSLQPFTFLSWWKHIGWKFTCSVAWSCRQKPFILLTKPFLFLKLYLFIHSFFFLFSLCVLNQIKNNTGGLYHHFLHLYYHCSITLSTMGTPSGLLVKATYT